MVVVVVVVVVVCKQLQLLQCNNSTDQRYWINETKRCPKDLYVETKV